MATNQQKGKAGGKLNLKDLKNLDIKTLFKRKQEEMVTETVAKSYEVNLVPDIKLELIQQQRVRNRVFFVCIVVVAISVGIVLMLSSVKVGQDVTMKGQDNRLEKMSSKVMGYKDLSAFLTIQDQLGKLAEIDENKNELSRIFSILTVMLPTNGDKVSISEMNVNLQNATVTFDGQADAGVEPLIDYRVLEAFKKSVAMTKYDYGRYVDAEGNEIPTWCIVETGENGETLTENGSIYAIWTRGRQGCDPATVAAELDDEEAVTPENNTTYTDEIVYRTPQFNSWYKDGYMDLDGSIEGVAHFDSACIAYSGVDIDGKSAHWTATNDDCLLSPDNGITVRDSSNGRDSSGNLVLRFTATITMDPQVFKFSNKHMMAIGPTGQNVTDSYMQVEGMFEERASDCVAGDTACTNNSANEGGA